MPLDLDPLKEFVEDNMTDECVVIRHSSEADARINELTGGLVMEDAAAPIYTGKCYISTQGWQPQEDTQGGAEMTESARKFAIPVGSEEIKLNDEVTITSSLRNPSLVGKVYVVRDFIESSFSVSQAYLVDRITKKPQR